MNFFKIASDAIKTNKNLFKKAFWTVLATVYVIVFIKLFVINK